MKNERGQRKTQKKEENTKKKNQRTTRKCQGPLCYYIPKHVCHGITMTGASVHLGIPFYGKTQCGKTSNRG